MKIASEFVTNSGWTWASGEAASRWNLQDKGIT